MRTKSVSDKAGGRARCGIGRPKSAEPYEKVTVCLYDRHILLLDKTALAIREKTGRIVRRAELVRALVEKSAGALDPRAKNFDRTVRRLLPNKE
jgi:hypothetical protein